LKYDAPTGGDTMTTLGFLAPKPAPIRTDADGVARVAGTRVRLDTVIAAFNAGCAAEEIVLKYPSLDLGDVYSVIAYYLWHRGEVDAYLEQRRQAADDARRELEARFPRQGLRERLLARRQGSA
jgi:uncharacterized protein (DUF433 family)